MYRHAGLESVLPMQRELFDSAPEQALVFVLIFAEGSAEAASSVTFGNGGVGGASDRGRLRGVHPGRRSTRGQGTARSSPRRRRGALSDAHEERGSFAPAAVARKERVAVRRYETPATTGSLDVEAAKSREPRPVETPEDSASGPGVSSVLPRGGSVSAGIPRSRDASEPPPRDCFSSCAFMHGLQNAPQL